MLVILFVQITNCFRFAFIDLLFAGGLFFLGDVAPTTAVPYPSTALGERWRAYDEVRVRSFSCRCGTTDYYRTLFAGSYNPSRG